MIYHYQRANQRSSPRRRRVIEGTPDSQSISHAANDNTPSNVGQIPYQQHHQGQHSQQPIPRPPPIPERRPFQDIRNTAHLPRELPALPPHPPQRAHQPQPPYAPSHHAPSNRSNSPTASLLSVHSRDNMSNINGINPGSNAPRSIDTESVHSVHSYDSRTSYSSNRSQLSNISEHSQLQPCHQYPSHLMDSMSSAPGPSSPYPSPFIENQPFPFPLNSPYPSSNGDRRYMPSPYVGSGAETKFKYHYNLLLFMRRPAQYQNTLHDATISAIFITVWSIANFIGYGMSDQVTRAQRERIFNHLILFLFAMVMTHKDIILCNGQMCLPMLLLFLFTVRMLIEFIANFELSYIGINCMVILCILLFTSGRFIFGYFAPSSQHSDIHWNLMRCHFFYRGSLIRWSSFVVYCWFSSIMILQLMDSLCLGRFDDEFALKDTLCMVKKIKFVTCDTVIVIYGVLVLSLWRKLQCIDMYFRRGQSMNLYYDLSVENHMFKEWFVAVFIFLGTYILCETFLTSLVVKKTILPFTVIFILIFNFWSN